MFDILHYILYIVIFFTMFLCCRLLFECCKLGYYICNNKCYNKKTSLETPLIP